MSNQVTAHFVQQYKSTMYMLAQQKKSKLEMCVIRETGVGKNVKLVEQTGVVEGVEDQARHSDTPIVETPSDARWVGPRDAEIADLKDTMDQLRMFIDPTQGYMAAQVAYLNRVKDRRIMAAFFGTAKSGEDGTTNRTFDTTNMQVAAGGVGLTVAKLIEAKRRLEMQDIDLSEEEVFIAPGPYEMEDLLGSTLVTSADYNTVKALVRGEIDTFLGFKFVPVPNGQILLSGTDRRIPVWCKSGMAFVTWDEIYSSLSIRHDKRDSVQCYSRLTCNATRLEEKKVVDILCVNP